MISVPWQWGQCRTCIIMLSLGWLGGCSASHTPQENSRPTPLKHPPAGLCAARCVQPGTTDERPDGPGTTLQSVGGYDHAGAECLPRGGRDEALVQRGGWW